MDRAILKIYGHDMNISQALKDQILPQLENTLTIANQINYLVRTKVIGFPDGKEFNISFDKNLTLTFRISNDNNNDITVSVKGDGEIIYFSIVSEFPIEYCIDTAFQVINRKLLLIDIMTS